MYVQDDVDRSNSSLLAALAAHEQVRNYERGAALFRAGQSPAGVHVLLSGEVELVFEQRDGTKSISFDVAGQILGLSSIVSGRIHEYTAVARTSVLTGFVDGEALFRILHQSPSRWFDVLRVLSRDIESCYERVKELVSTRRPGVMTS